MKIKSLQLFQKHGLRMLFLAMSLLSTSLTFAYDFQVDGIYYDIKNGNEVQVTSRAHTFPNDSYSGDVIIPPTVTYNGKTYSVTSIGNYAFEYAYDLKSISIPNSITYIGVDAFSSSGLTSVNITDLASWCKIDFDYKTSTSSGLIENTSNPLSIAHHLFLNGTEITNLVIPNTVTSISTCAFFGCTGITSVSIPNSVTKIGGWAFYRCSGLTGTLTIPNSVISIGKNAFEYCSGLTGSLAIPNSVINIGESAFAYCSGLTSLSIGNSVTHIGAFAFKDCGSLTILNFNATSCQDFEFGYLCPFMGTVISTIEIGNSVQKIPSHFVYGLSTIRTVSIGNSVTSIGSCAFYDCSGLKSVYSIAANPPVMASSLCFYNCYNSAILYVPYDAISTYKYTDYWNNFKNIYGVDAEGNVLVSEISLNKTNIHLNVNQTYKLSAYVTPVVAANKKVNWSSSNSGVATVDTVGLVTAIADGTAIITATTTDGTNLSASCMVTASSIPVSSISLNKASLTLDICDTYQLVATIDPDFATNKTIVWESSNPSVATVSSDGLVTPIALGNVTITATTTDGTNLSASCQVTVVRRVKGISLSKSNLELKLPETAQLNATITPTDATNPMLNWTSSNTYVATVDGNGFITTKAAGTTTITATTTDGSNLSASCQVTVIRVFITSISLNESNLTMHIGETAQLIADVLPEYASNPYLSWSSSNSSVASVDNNGLVTAKTGGTTYVRASSTDGSYLSASCTIEVLPDYYITLDTLSHIRGTAAQIVDLPVTLVNKNPISGIQYDVLLPDSVKFNVIDGLPDIWLDDARSTRTHSVTASQLNNGKYRVLVTSSSSKELKGNDGELVHMNMLLPRLHNTGNYSINVSNIIASEADETRHALDSKSAKVSFYYIVGDADANTFVDIADHAATASKILGKSPSPFYGNAANVDGNDSLDVVDLVGITNIALEIRPITILQAPAIGGIVSQLYCDKLRPNSTGEAEVNVGIDCGFNFAGFQMDLDLPDGLTLTSVELGDQTSAFGLTVEEQYNGKIRILGTSFSDAEISGVCPQLLRLKIKAERNYSQGSNIGFSDILFAERNLTAHHFDGSCIGYVEPSKVYELMDDAKIYVEYGNVIVDTPVAGIVQLIAVDGRMIEYQAQIGHNVFEVGVTGVYMIHFNGQTIKVRF